MYHQKADQHQQPCSENRSGNDSPQVEVRQINGCGSVPTIPGQLVYVDGQVDRCGGGGRNGFGPHQEVGRSGLACMNMERVISETESLCSRLQELQGKSLPPGYPLPRNPPLMLVVEDVLEEQELMGYVLKGIGCELEMVSTGEEAIEKIKKSCVDDRPAFNMVLLDLMLKAGRMNGHLVLRWINQNLPALPVVIVSGHVAPHQFDDLRREGYFSVIEKPLKQENLQSILARHRIII